ncbi:metallophosphoesterase [Kushneria aurantia]|uniref:Metallophosphoesterase n=1 Tax=Kushneria aurantia TaxID=504092 RepID=A0ABV6G4P1_9GAMM|nr:metallophosphoesterase [Kushneria aurantia]
MMADDGGVDLIGDIHGCATLLTRLLEKMGYRLHGGVWRHPDRQVIFVGDLIDRGPEVRQTLDIVYRMVAEGEAQIVLGNHEVRALRECLPSEQGGRPRSPGPGGERVLRATLEQFEGAPGLWSHYLEWFARLPLCLEFEHFRVAHALWDEKLLRPFLACRPDGCIDRPWLAAAIPGSHEQHLLDSTTRGVGLRLPRGWQVQARDGAVRHSFRAGFWYATPRTLGEVLFQPDPLPAALAAQPLGDEACDRLVYYAPQQRPLFVGHYWCRGVPALPAPNIACLDYSAVRGGRLVAYRFDGEQVLDAGRLCWIDADRTLR